MSSTIVCLRRSRVAGADNVQMDTALIVIDMQRDVMATCPAAEPVLATVNALITRARRNGTPIVFVRHHDDDLVAGTDSWQLDPRLDHDVRDVIVDKTYRDGFANTELDDVLHRLGIHQLVITGAHSDFCVQTTALSALAHGYDITLVADGHAAEATLIAGVELAAATVTDFVNARMATLRYPGRKVDVLSAADVNL